MKKTDYHITKVRIKLKMSSHRKLVDCMLHQSVNNDKSRDNVYNNAKLSWLAELKIPQKQNMYCSIKHFKTSDTILTSPNGMPQVQYARPHYFPSQQCTEFSDSQIQIKFNIQVNSFTNLCRTSKKGYKCLYKNMLHILIHNMVEL